MMVDEQALQSPRDFEALRAMIVERRDSLPKRLAQVAVYALDNPDEIAFGTAASIAQSAIVQPSTLVRFAQAFGYQGFSELQEVFRSRLRERVLSYDERLQRMRQHGIADLEVEPRARRLPGGGAALGFGFSRQDRPRYAGARRRHACRRPRRST